ncbi:hypothetical protein GCM10023258_08310 [Terrabacter aeriphilus]|uniref:Threonine/homoserine/homoserine lactone efflux protein n=1 Tax=Terrabacter aeriphilus TaxID=515662 RepID=A0ABP9J620_9MICO
MLLSFIATTWLLAMLPGVGQALMLRQTLTGGRRAAVPTILGTATGLVVWSVAAGVGMSAAVVAVPAVYRALLIAGGLLLAALGVRTLAATRRGAVAAPADDASRPPRFRTAYGWGLATNLGNPKAGVFAISLLPTFAGSSALLPTLGLGLVWACVTAAWYLVFVTLVSRGRAFVTRPRAQKAVGYTSGLVLIGVGVGVACGL